jgi:hypothetical protein
VISPALANCALDGLERLLRENYPAGKRLKSLGGEKPCVNLVRYADDFVITSKSKELLAGEIKPLVEHFLQERGLEPRLKARAGSNRNTLTGVGIGIGPSSAKPAMTKDGQIKSGCTTP